MNGSSHAERGNALLMEGNLDEAIAVFEGGLKADGRDTGCLLGLARVHLASSEPQEAHAVLQRLIAIEPSHPEARSHLALMRVEDGDEEALETLEQIARRPEAGFSELFNFAIASFDRGEWDLADGHFRRALEKDPENPAVWLHLGLISREREDLDGALDCYEHASQGAPDEFLPLLMKARVLAAKGDLTQSMKTLDAAMELAPEEPQPVEEKIKLYLASGSSEGAVGAARYLCKLQPEDANAWYLLGLSLFMDVQLPQAKEALESSIELAPEAWEPKQALAKVFRSLENDEAALQLLQQAHTVAPTEPGPANDLAILHLEKGEPEVAENILRTALEADPEEPTLNLNFALAVGERDPEKARLHAGHALASEDPDIREQAEQILSKLPA
jgi:tetratricopeptide (TPR) repeat protein